MIGRYILDATVAAREEKTISTAMTWAYNVSRLVLVRKTEHCEEIDAEITAYIQYKS